jgi:hypothetical protein
VFRESYTSARDFYNTQRATYLMALISAQEVPGIIHQTTEPFDNDAGTTIMRGHIFLPPSVFSITGSALGWTATMLKKQGHWTIIKVPLEHGKNLISIKLEMPGSPKNASVWTLSNKTCNRKSASYPNELPQPEIFFLQSINMVEIF